MTVYLYLVRHGQSVGNERQLFFGHSDHPLTELGREQAKQAADKLKEVSFTRCVSSDLSRAMDTARICAEGRGIPGGGDPAHRGGAPSQCPILRPAPKPPAIESAVHTTPPITIAATMPDVPLRPIATKIADAIISVISVMPDTGLEPTRPY